MIITCTDPPRCQYFEAHGTGTIAGDPVEAEAISNALFSNPTEKIGDCESDLLFVGSIKTVVGHLEGTAGIASLLKVSLALQNRTIPPNMHFNHLHKNFAPFRRYLQVPVKPIPWPVPPGGEPLRASVNSFGFGGTNAHAIIESHTIVSQPPKTVPPSIISERAVELTTPLLFSATSEHSLVATIQNHRLFLGTQSAVNLQNVAWTLQCRRSTFPIKAAFSGTTKEEILEQIDQRLSSALAEAPTPIGRCSQPSTGTSRPRILGIFTGQGAQWPLMGRKLITSSPIFAQTIHELEVTLNKLPVPPGWSLHAELMAPTPSSRVHEAAYSQPLCTAVQIALVDLLQYVGITFDVVIGHSSGEIAAVSFSLCN